MYRRKAGWGALSLAPPGRLRAEIRYRRAVYVEQPAEGDIT